LKLHKKSDMLPTVNVLNRTAWTDHILNTKELRDISSFYCTSTT